MVQKALGHHSIATTTIYAYIDDGELEEAMKGFRRR
jgi:site-specific recombinase XerD